MKKLIGLLAVVLVLFFAPVSIGWAAPGQHHDQQKKEQTKKTVKHSNRQKLAVNAKAKAPPDHNRSRITSISHHTRDHTAATVKTPPNHANGKIKSDSHQVHRVVDDKVNQPVYRDRRNNDRHWQARSGYHDTPAYNRLLQRHRSQQRWPDGDVWHRRFRDWSWFGSHRAHNFDTCYDQHGRPLYTSYEPLEDDYLYLLEDRYGGYHHRERHHWHGVNGWCYYWFAGDNVIALFAGDAGYTQVYIWQRSDVEDQALSLGILTPDLQIVYSRYDGAMPPELAAGYARDVLWATVDDET